MAITGKSQSHGKQARAGARVEGQHRSHRHGHLGKAEAQIWEAKGFRQGAISIFILFHLIAILCWTIPTDYPFMVGVRGLVGPYMQWAGLVPVVGHLRPQSESGEQLYQSSCHHPTWPYARFAFPRMEQLGLGERYGKERYRKFAENLVVAGNAPVLPDIARHVARLYKNPADPPDKVVLVQFRGGYHAVGAKRRRPAPRPVVFYEDFVEQEDLK